ncbi:glycine betaine transporter 1-like isoform X2 [Bolinopsis microptera]
MAGKEAPPYEITEPSVDPPPRPTWKGAKIKDKSVWFKAECGPIKLKLNPIVTISSILVIIAFILWCILERDHALDSFGSAKTWITRTFTWLYVGSQDVWAVVIIAIYFSKYGQLKLGQDDEKPEYNDGTWFAMLFACGVGVGLFFFGVAEPLWHYIGPNRYTSDKYMPDNEVAQWAMNVTFFHWGIHGWIVYVMIGIILGFLTFRKGMPMTMKSCFYPLIGDRIYGWMGDIIDIFSILTTLFGVCTSLGLGTMQVNKGLNFLNEDIEVNTQNQVIIIWAITLVATTSVITGVGVGIRRLSEICFGIGMVIMLLVLFLEDTWYILNLYCQSIGFYIQWIMQLGFHCDAFELSTKSFGAADRGRVYADGEGDGPEGWMDGWTIFYWGWWISWSPFVGMFIAKISRGRTIRQFINGTLTAPMIYTFMWLTIFGGAAIKTERLAAAEGLCCPKFNSTVLAWNSANFTDAGWDMNLNGVQLSKSNLKLCKGTEDASIACGDCEWKLMKTFIDSHETSSATVIEVVGYVNDNERWLGKYKSRDDKSHARLSCMASEEMWFATVSTYGDMGPFLCVISLAGIILYFVTSSDSGSLVIDIMSANGDQDPPIPQRVFWAVVEGATATALLVAGGSDALKALQTASVAAGLPYTIILCFVTVALWRALAMECGDLNPYGPDFAVSLVDPFSTLRPRLWLGFIKNLFIAPMTLYDVLKAHKKSALGPAIMAAVCWVAWIALIIAEIVYQFDKSLKLEGIYALAWVFYLGFVTLLTVARANIRSHYGINGNPIEDFFAAMFVYPCVLIQLETVSDKNGLAPLMPDSASKEPGYSDVMHNKNHETYA